jgi:hypothetical protein
LGAVALGRVLGDEIHALDETCQGAIAVFSEDSYAEKPGLLCHAVLGTADGGSNMSPMAVIVCVDVVYEIGDHLRPSFEVLPQSKY